MPTFQWFARGRRMSDQHAQDQVLEVREERGRHPGRFRVGVAEASFEFRQIFIFDPVVTGRQVIEEAGYWPAEEYLVFQVLGNGALESLRLDETTRLLGGGAERFIVFRSDRSFRLVVDERRHEWGASEVTGLLVKQIGGVEPECSGVWLELGDEPDRFIGDDDTVTLSGESIERFRTGPIYTLCIEGTEYSWPKPTIAAEEIAELGGWDPKLGVQEVNLATGESRTLAPGEVVEIEACKGYSKKIGWRRG